MLSRFGAPSAERTRTFARSRRARYYRGYRATFTVLYTMAILRHCHHHHPRPSPVSPAVLSFVSPVSVCNSPQYLLRYV